MIQLNKKQREFVASELGILEIPTAKGDIEDILSKLVDLLLSKGFKEDWEPNEYGLKVEDLIDVFNREFRKLEDANSLNE